MDEENRTDNLQESSYEEGSIEPREKLTLKERKKKVQKRKKREKAIAKQRSRSYSYKDTDKDKREIDRAKSVISLKNFRFTPLRIFIMVVAALLVFILLMLFINRDLASFENISNYISYGIFNAVSEKRFPISIQGSSVSSGNFNRMGSYLCYTSDTSFGIYNNYGVPVYTSQISYTQPVLRCSDERCIVYALGDKGFQINSRSGNIYEGECENNILTADINDRGMYAIVTQFDGYLAKLFVYDKDNTQIYAYAFADYYITSVSINSNGQEVMLSGITALDGAEHSAVYVLDITKKEPIIFEQFDDTMLYSVSFLGDNYGCAIGNSMCCGFKISSGHFAVTQYEGKTLTAYTVNRTNNTFNVSVSRSGDGRNCNIYTFSAAGEKIGNNETAIAVSSLSAYKTSIAALSGSDVYLFNKTGRQLSKKNAGLDPHSIVLYTRNDAYILGVADISRMSL